MKRKNLRFLSAMLATSMLVGTVLVGCSSKTSSETAAADSGEASEAVADGSEAMSEAAASAGSEVSEGNLLDTYSSDEKVTLTLYTTQDRTQSRLYVQENFDAFEEAYPNIKIELQVVPDDQQTTLLQTKLATGDVPDIIHTNWTSANPYQFEKNFETFDDQEWASRLKQNDVLMLPINGVAEHIYMFSPEIPIEATGIVYNKAIFEEAGITEVPRTYDDFLAACEKIKAIGKIPFYIPGKDAWTTQVWQTCAVGDVNKNVDPSFMNNLNTGVTSWADSEEFIEINEKYYNLVKLGYTNKNVLSDDFNSAQADFAAGEYAMLAMGDWFIPLVEGINPDLSVGIFPIPCRDNADLTCGKVSGFMIPSKAKHLTEAKLFLEFLAQPEQLQRMQEANPYITNFVDGPQGELAAYQQDSMVYVEAGQTCAEMNNYLLVDNAELWKGYQDMLGGQKTPKEVAESWDSVFKQLMQDKGIEGF